MSNSVYCCLWVSLVVATPALLAQGTSLGTIRGTVSDPTAASIPGAKIVITDLTTNLPLLLSTDSEGNYEGRDLKYGEYKITVSMDGFNNTEISGVNLRGGDIKRVDVKLSVKTAEEAVTVTG